MFLQQDYDGPMEQIIVNDFEEQHICFDHPNVRVVNLKNRFETVGQKRNYAIGLCSGEVILTYDDDDIILCNHLSVWASPS